MNRRLDGTIRLALILLVFLYIPAALADAKQPKTTSVIRVAAMGDIMMGTEGFLPEDGGKGAFAAVTPFLKGAGIVFGNQEGALANAGTCIRPGENPYCFKSPPEYAAHYKKAGFNMLSIGNNHLHDYGPEAKEETMRTLERYGIGYSGPPGTMASVSVNGLKIGMIAFYPGLGSNPISDMEAVKALVKETKHGLDILIVSFHAGAEGKDATRVRPGCEMFMGEDRGDVVAFARAAVDAGADLLLGHGPHVPRAMELYKDRLIAYSLGNFCTYRRINVKGINGYAPLLLADLDGKGRLVGGRVVSFIQEFCKYPRLDSNKSAAKLIYRLGREDLPKSNAVAADGRLIVKKQTETIRQKIGEAANPGCYRPDHAKGANGKSCHPYISDNYQ